MEIIIAITTLPVCYLIGAWIHGDEDGLDWFWPYGLWLDCRRRLPGGPMARETIGEIGYATHEQLWKICTKLVTDFEPYGKRKRDIGDCSAGCKFYHVLEGPRGADWGVCWNPKSPRAGLLTFEHMGCPKFASSQGGPTVAEGVRK